MITELLIDMLVGLVNIITSLLPTAAPPAWVADGSGYLSAIWASGAGLGAWLPWPLIGTVFTAVLVSVGVGLGIKVVRLVASYLTAGGGSAG